MVVLRAGPAIPSQTHSTRLQPCSWWCSRESCSSILWEGAQGCCGGSDPHPGQGEPGGTPVQSRVTGLSVIPAFPAFSWLALLHGLGPPQPSLLDPAILKQQELPYPDQSIPGQAPLSVHHFPRGLCGIHPLQPQGLLWPGWGLVCTGLAPGQG